VQPSVGDDRGRDVVIFVTAKMAGGAEAAATRRPRRIELGSTRLAKNGEINYRWKYSALVRSEARLFSADTYVRAQRSYNGAR